METVFPPAPSWYLPQICRTSSTGRVAYGARNVLVVIDCSTYKDPDCAPDVDVDSKSPSIEGSWRDRSSSPVEKVASEIVKHPIASAHTICSDKTKIGCVSWSPDSRQVCVGSDDGLVKVVNVEDGDVGTVLTCVQVHSTHKEVSKDRSAVNAICWSQVNPDLVVSGDDLGTIVLWDVKGNATRFVTFGRNPVSVLQTHPFDGDLVAFGCKQGLVFIVNVSGSGKVVQKIRAHDEDIQGLSWSPSKTREVFQSDVESDRVVDSPESLLTASSRDKSISIWSSKSGEKLATMRLPGRPDHKSKFKQDAFRQSWTTCLWVRKDVLLSSGVNGELLLWRLDRLRRKSPGNPFFSDGQEARILHHEHQRTLFSISHFHENVIFTSGQDRSIVAFRLDSKSIIFNLPTFACGVYTIVPNSIDSSIVAIGAGDGIIRVWKMSSTETTFDLTSIWNKLSKSKITALAWHPEREGLLAFGTDEGRIGVLDGLSPRSQPNFYEYKHRATVYSVCWGPAICDSDIGGSSKKVLYSCGDNVVIMHEETSRRGINIENILRDRLMAPAEQEDPSADADKNPPSEKDLPETQSDEGGKTLSDKPAPKTQQRRPNRSDILFQPVLFKYLLIGSDDGSVEIFSMPKFVPVCILKSFNKLIQNMAWHPLYIGTSSSRSPLHNWLAVASNEYDIHVWDLSQALAATDTTSEAVPVLSNPTVVLSGHLLRVISLSWSPHEDGKLLSVSYDGTAQIWDAKSATPIANFSGHLSKLFCCLWSPLDKDVAYTGGDDATLFGWRVSGQKETIPIKKSNRKVPQMGSAKEANVSAETLQDLIAEKRQQLLQLQSEESKVSEDPGCKEATIQLDPKAQLVKRRNQRKVLFNVSQQQQKNWMTDSYKECEVLEGFRSDGVDSQLDNFPELGFFTDKKGLENILEKEETFHRSQGNEDMAGFLATFTGDYGRTVRQAITASKLTDWHVSLACATGYSLWKESCQAYASQLIRDEEIIKGCSYLLMIGQVFEAIEVFRKNDFYFEAISIAKSRLPSDAPIIQELYESWATESMKNGRYSVAAKCWIAVGDLQKASVAISRQKDPSSIRVAAKFAGKAGDQEKSRVLSIQCATQCLQASDWKCLDKLATQCEWPEVVEMLNKSIELRKEGNDAKDDKSKTQVSNGLKENLKPVSPQMDNIANDHEAKNVNTGDVANSDKDGNKANNGDVANIVEDGNKENTGSDGAKIAAAGDTEDCDESKNPEVSAKADAVDNVNGRQPEACEAPTIDDPGTT